MRATFIVPRPSIKVVWLPALAAYRTSLLGEVTIMKRLLIALVLLVVSSFAIAAVNINTATKEQLDALPGIGPVKAQAIIDYRNANGPFKTPADVMKVKGIKEGEFGKIKDQIAVSGATVTAAPPPAPAKAEPAKTTPAMAAPPVKAEPAKTAPAMAAPPATPAPGAAPAPPAMSKADEAKAAKAKAKEEKAKKAADDKAAKEKAKADKAESAKAAKEQTAKDKSTSDKDAKAAKATTDATKDKDKAPK
jgi:competence protein ComEA